MFLLTLILGIYSIDRTAASKKRDAIRRERILQFKEHNPFRKNITRKLLTHLNSTQKTVVEETDDMLNTQNDRSKNMEKINLKEQEPESKFIASRNKDNMNDENKHAEKAHPEEKSENTENTQEKTRKEPNTPKKMDDPKTADIFNKTRKGRPIISKPGNEDSGDPTNDQKHGETKEGENSSVSSMPNDKSPIKQPKVNQKELISSTNKDKGEKINETSSNSEEKNLQKIKNKLNVTKEDSVAKNNNSELSKPLPEGKSNNITNYGNKTIKSDKTDANNNKTIKTTVSTENDKEIKNTKNKSSKTELNDTKTTDHDIDEYEMMEDGLYKDPFLDEFDDDLMSGPRNPRFAFFHRRHDNGSLICGENAYSPDNMTCQCKDPYTEGDPYDISGCYKCDVKCSTWAGCYRDNTCRCMLGFTGNGTFCESDTIKLLNIAPLKNRKIFVQFAFQSDGKLGSIYCKFDSTIVKGQETTISSTVCEIPTGIDTKFSFSISKNPSKFEDDNVVYDLPKSENMKNKKTMSIVFFISMVLVTICLSNTKKPKKQLQRKIIKELPKPGEEDVDTTMNFNDVNGTIDDIGNTPNDIDDDADEESVYSQPIDTNVPFPANVLTSQQPIQQP